MSLNSESNLCLLSILLKFGLHCIVNSVTLLLDVGHASMHYHRLLIEQFLADNIQYDPLEVCGGVFIYRVLSTGCILSMLGQWVCSPQPITMRRM